MVQVVDCFCLWGGSGWCVMCFSCLVGCMCGSGVVQLWSVLEYPHAVSVVGSVSMT